MGLFLHGTERAAPEVSIAWRSDITDADLADEAGAAKLGAILELVPPRSAEMIEVPIWAAAAWLRRWNTARAAQLADVAEREDDLEVGLSETDRKAFRWAGANDPRTGLVSAGNLRVGDVLDPGAGAAAQRGDDRGADLGRGRVAAPLEHGARRTTRRRGGA